MKSNLFFVFNGNTLCRHIMVFEFCDNNTRMTFQYMDKPLSHCEGAGHFF